MSSLRNLLHSRLVLSPPGQGEDGRVLQLFQNRTQLKRAFAQAQDEIHLLRDRIKLQEGATARVREQLQALETLLAVPSTGLQALVHYQLRALWELARGQVDTLVHELAAQRGEYERRIHAAKQNRDAFEVQQRLQRALAHAERDSAEVREKLALLRERILASSAWWEYFRRKSLCRRQQALQAEALAAQAGLEAARGALEAHEGAETVEFPGLSLEARRAINGVAIAYAALVAARLEPGRLIEPAREAMRRSEPAAQAPVAGTALVGMMERIGAAQDVVRACGNASAPVRQLATELQRVARYARESDAVPTADSLDDVLLVARGDVACRRNVLRENLWDLDELLL